MLATTLIDSLSDCESVRLDLNGPLERLREAVADEDTYETDALIRECLTGLTELQDACGCVAAECSNSRSLHRQDATLLHRELVIITRDLKSVSDSGVDGEELQERLEDWHDTFDDWDGSLADLIDVLRTEHL